MNTTNRLSIFQTPTPNLTDSIEFYQKLNFEIVNLADQTYACGKNLIIQINADRFARTGIKILVSNQELKSNFQDIDNQTETTQGIMTVSPEGVVIYIESVKSDKLSSLKNDINTSLGNFNGISIESINIDSSLKFWSKIGFNLVSGKTEDGWVMIKDESGFEINLMRYNLCPHLFINPGLNFFNGKANTQIIKNIRTANIRILEEITHFNPGHPADNIIIQDPGGLTAFLFND